MLFSNLKFIFDNSKLQEFETVRTLKINKKRPNLYQKNILGSKNEEKPTKNKERKVKTTFQNPFFHKCFSTKSGSGPTKKYCLTHIKENRNNY